ncbi:MAG: HD domain-containing protein, partial [Acidobacteria bacterium]
ITSELKVDAASVLLFNPHTHNLKYFSGLGFRNIAIAHSEINLGEGVAGKAGLERELIRIPDLRDSEEASRRAELLAEEEFVAYYAMPLVARGELKGVLEIFNRSALSPDQDWLDFLSAVASQAAVAMDNADLIAKLQRHNTGLGFAYDATLEGLSSALDLREQISSGHSQQLAEWTLKLGETVGMEGPDLINDRRGALMHDIGKIGVPESILLKPAPLSDKEWDTMHMHPRYAHRLLSDIPYLRSAVNIPYCHHEKWDGSGYPRGLKGKEIPLAARVFSVVGAWDVLGRDRPYREAWPNMKIREHLKSQSGIDFDPEIVEKFLELEREGAFTRDALSKELITLEEIPEEKPVHERVEEKRTEAEPPKEVTAAEPTAPKEEVTEKPQEEVTEESKGTVLGRLKGKITESSKGKVSKEPEETVTEEPQETVSQEEPEKTGLKPEEKAIPKEPEKIDLKLKEKVTQGEPEETDLKFKETVTQEEPEETGLKPKEEVSPEEPKGTNSEPPMIFSEPLMGTMTQELNESAGEGKVTERLMGITTPEPLEAEAKEEKDT